MQRYLCSSLNHLWLCICRYKILLSSYCQFNSLCSSRTPLRTHGQDISQKNPIIRRKQFFTLLELTIAFALITTILFFLLLASKNFLLFEKRITLAKEEVHRHSHLQMRLEYLFSQILPSSFLTQGQPPLYTAMFPKEKQESLVFLFDNGVDPDPKFSGPLLGRIFLKDRELHLLIWPLEKDGALSPLWREELLAREVDKIVFTFFTEEQKEGESSFLWLSRWSEEKKEIPFMIRLGVQREKKQTLFAFFPHAASSSIIYREKRL